MSRGRRARRRRRPFLVAAVATLGTLVAMVVVVAVAGGLFVASLGQSYSARTTTIEHAFPKSERPVADPAGAMNVLLIGSDSRSRLDPDGDRAGGGRSDTLMLVHLAADRRSVDVMSIMRDSWVDVPGHGSAKINAAFSWGGIPLAVQTVEALLDVRIDHVAEIDFEGFRDMTDALGGVDVTSDRAFDARGTAIRAGENHLDGSEALDFVRERYAFADADHQRVKNQQAFLRGVVDGVLSAGTLTNPARISHLVDASSAYLSVDAGLSFRALTAIGWSLRHITSADLHTFTMPTAGGGVSPDGQSYVAVNQIELASLKSALRSDDLRGWLAAHR